MYSSRKIEDLRPDVAENCRTWLALCKAEGLNVLITDTVRDKEYQEMCFQKGYSATPTPSFHAQGVGLAFDFCRNIKGQEYSSYEFIERCGVIAERMGFEWGGRWKSFVDNPHIQWSDGGKYTSKMIREGKRPRTMPLYQVEQKEEEEDMVIYKTLNDVPPSYQDTIRKLMSTPRKDDKSKMVLVGYSDPDPTKLDDNIINVDESYCRVMTTLDRLGKL